ncbi:FecR family protein [Erythrobacter sp. JK5]|uniref:FecR family protein n=1 Tax=Erythrobacter sp. JK5 TaxID=2829500 RepID=UPI001BA86D24|nr:FecR family protein [Erythrobacter sp. JK5]QUL36766.1 FecR domain-containing protein [Erythrobacter sp. JK5]
MLGHAKKSLALAALLASTSAFAAAPDWRVSEASGNVTVERGGTVLDARQNTVLLPGDILRTGNKGRAVLVRGKEFVVVSPDAKLQVAVPEKSGPVVQFFQYLGNALFKIEKKSTPHFGVKTPYLAAVVKGTTFNVSVGAERSSVQVTEGAVEVATGDDLEAALLTPGLIGLVEGSDAGELVVIAGSRAGEDLSGAVVRGSPEFRATPPQARSNRSGNLGAPGASGSTPAAQRTANGHREGSPIALSLLDDDVAGGELIRAALAGAENGNDSAAETIFGARSTARQVVVEQRDQGVGSDRDDTEVIGSGASAEAPVDEGSADVEIVGDDGDNGHGNDPDRSDETNPGRGKGGGDEADGSGIELDVDAGNDPVGIEIDAGIDAGIDGGSEEQDVGADLGLTSGPDDDDEDDDDDGNRGHGNDDDGDDDDNPDKGNGQGRLSADEADGSGIELDIDVGEASAVAQLDLGFGGDTEGSQGVIIDVGADLDLDLDDDDGNRGHGNDDDDDDEDNRGRGKGKGKGHGKGGGPGKGGGKGSP